jgi:uncharacterized protein YndB with AHSA1/START domain
MTEAGQDAREGMLMREVGGRWKLRFVRRLRQSREKVWRALTEERHLSGWFPTTIEGELNAGSSLRFTFRGQELPPQHGVVVACNPPSLLEFTWFGSPDHEEGDETSRFELADDGDGCVLTFSTMYEAVGKSARDAAGWHVCLDHLELELEGRREAAPDPAPWARLSREYAEKFGPAAATIGPPAGVVIPGEAADEAST